MKRFFAIAICTLYCVAAAKAADLYVDAAAGLKDPVGSPGWADAWLSELRVGGLYHDAGVFGNHKEGGEDVNAEVLFTSPDILSVIWSPRPHLGTNINDDGYTSQVYGGLTWTYDFTQNLFGEFSEGGSVNDGQLNKTDHHHKALGSPVLFRESLSLGWRFDEHNSLSAMLDHISNAGLARYNGGLDTAGLRYGYRF